MKILIISPIYPEPEYYNIPHDTKVVHYFTKNWTDKGHQVIVIHPYYNALKNIKHLSSKYAHKISHYDIDKVTVIYGETQLFIPHSLFPAEWREIKLAKRMKRYMKINFPNFVPDVVSVHFPIVLQNFVSAFLNGEKTLAVFHGTDIRLLQSKVNGFSSLVECLNNTYKFFLFRSPKLMASGIKNGLKAQNSGILISGIKSSMIADRCFIDHKIKSNSSILTILYAGKVVKQKRIEQILKALSLIKKNMAFHFDIIGEGSDRQDLEKISKKLGITAYVTFYGAMSRDAVSKKMSQTDVFIMTSSNETLGLVYLEAMAQGCLTIGSRGEGIDGIIIDNDNGFLVNPDDVNDIAKCIKHVSRIDMGEKSRIIVNAYNTVVNLTDDNISEHYLSLLEDISQTNRTISPIPHRLSHYY